MGDMLFDGALQQGKRSLLKCRIINQMPVQSGFGQTVDLILLVKRQVSLGADDNKT